MHFTIILLDFNNNSPLFLLMHILSSLVSYYREVQDQIKVIGLRRWALIAYLRAASHYPSVVKKEIRLEQQDRTSCATALNDWL